MEIQILGGLTASMHGCLVITSGIDDLKLFHPSGETANVVYPVAAFVDDGSTTEQEAMVDTANMYAGYHRLLGCDDDVAGEAEPVECADPIFAHSAIDCATTGAEKGLTKTIVTLTNPLNQLHGCYLPISGPYASNQVGVFKDTGTNAEKSTLDSVTLGQFGEYERIYSSGNNMFAFTLTDCSTMAVEQRSLKAAVEVVDAMPDVHGCYEATSGQYAGHPVFMDDGTVEQQTVMKGVTLPQRQGDLRRLYMCKATTTVATPAITTAVTTSHRSTTTPTITARSVPATSTTFIASATLAGTAANTPTTEQPGGGGGGGGGGDSTVKVKKTGASAATPQPSVENDDPANRGNSNNTNTDDNVNSGTNPGDGGVDGGDGSLVAPAPTPTTTTAAASGTADGSKKGGAGVGVGVGVAVTLLLLLLLLVGVFIYRGRPTNTGQHVRASMSVRVCVCVRLCVRVCVRACVRACACRSLLCAFS
jgi:hypothetical protein